MSTVGDIEKQLAQLSPVDLARVAETARRLGARGLPSVYSPIERLAALEALTDGLNLDEEKMRQWQQTVRDARP